MTRIRPTRIFSVRCWQGCNENRDRLQRNFSTTSAEAHFLCNLRSVAGENGSLLIGVSLKKDSAIFSAAYNDTKGVTAAFNRNLLYRIRRELDAEIEPEQFTLHASYNDQLAARADYVSRRAWTDADNPFSLHYFDVKA